MNIQDKVKGLRDVIIDASSEALYDQLELVLESYTRVVESLAEFLEVAAFRGDDELPAPEDDPVEYTYRMQVAWNDLKGAYLKCEPVEVTDKAQKGGNNAE